MTLYGMLSLYRQSYYYLYLGLIGSKTILVEFLTVERLKAFSDSVLLVAITILAYNLAPPSLINGRLSGNEVQSFLDNVYGLISSFFVIFVFWVLYTKILDYMKKPDDIVILTSLTFFILVLLIPVFTLAEFQYKSLQSVVSLALLQITNDLLLVLLWVYLIKHKKHLMTQEGDLISTTDNRYMYSRLTIIPCLYIVTIGIAFFVSIRIAAIFPVIIVPAMVLLSRVFGSKKNRKKNTTNL
jgi:uncharacterized membrane protein